MRLLVIFLFPLTTLSQTLNFIVCEGLWSKPLEGTHIMLSADTVNQTVFSDKNGKVSVNTKSVNAITFTHPSGNYKSRTLLLDSNFSVNKLIYLYPTLAFESSFPNTKPLSEMKIDTTSSPITIIDDIEHTFDGGNDAMMKFFTTNIIYPFEAIQNKWEGKCTIRFLGEKDGSVTRVTVEKSSGHEILDDEAKRVLRSSPKWIAPKEKDQFVRSFNSFPITFMLNE